jgi:hypothetical protein
MQIDKKEASAENASLFIFKGIIISPAILKQKIKYEKNRIS